MASIWRPHTKLIAGLYGKDFGYGPYGQDGQFVLFLDLWQLAGVFLISCQIDWSWVGRLVQWQCQLWSFKSVDTKIVKPRPYKVFFAFRHVHCQAEFFFAFKPRSFILFCRVCKFFESSGALASQTFDWFLIKHYPTVSYILIGCEFRKILFKKTIK